MNNKSKYLTTLSLLLIVGMILMQGCKKGNPNNLPSVSPADLLKNRRF